MATVRQSKIASQQRPTTYHISFTSNMKCLFSTMALLLFSACYAFTSVPKSKNQQSVSSLLPMSSVPSESGDSYWSDEFEDDACWQNIYDDDCAMSTANLAFFKASTWVKGMPCAEGIEVCNKILLCSPTIISCIDTLCLLHFLYHRTVTCLMPCSFRVGRRLGHTKKSTSPSFSISRGPSILEK